jgi:hypothetical protein
VTQPADTGNGDTGGDTGKVIAAAAVALALIAVERQVRDQVHDDIAAAFKTLAAAAVIAASTAPATILTGLALLALPAFHAALIAAITRAREDTATGVHAAYVAAAQVAQSKVTADLAHDGYSVPAELPELGDNIDRILADVDTMFGHAQTDVQNTLHTAYDAATTPEARTVAVNQAVTDAEARLQQRAAAAASTATHKGSTDAEQAIFNEYQNSTGTPGLMKRWRTTSNDPCGMCDALNGTMVGVNAEFDHNATTVDKDLRTVWRTLAGPPRHPNCRCQLELVKT